MSRNDNNWLHVPVVGLQETDCLTYSEHYLPIGHSTTTAKAQYCTACAPTSPWWEMTSSDITRRHLLKGQEIIVLPSESKGFGICLLRECDWKGAFGKGDNGNLDTVETRETVGRSLMGKHSLGRLRGKPALYQIFDRLAGRGIWKHVVGICTKALIFLERHFYVRQDSQFVPQH